MVFTIICVVFLEASNLIAILARAPADFGAAEYCDGLRAQGFVVDGGDDGDGGDAGDAGDDGDE